MVDKIKKMVEALLSGIVLGLIPITLVGLFVTAYLQYRRGDQLDLWIIFLNSNFLKLAESRSVGFEPTTSGFGDLRSTELN